MPFICQSMPTTPSLPLATIHSGPSAVSMEFFRDVSESGRATLVASYGYHGFQWGASATCVPSPVTQSCAFAAPSSATANNALDVAEFRLPPCLCSYVVFRLYKPTVPHRSLNVHSMGFGGYHVDQFPPSTSPLEGKTKPVKGVEESARLVGVYIPYFH